MALQSHLRELDAKHQMLERAIEDETSRPIADTIRLKELKRQKLRLKEEMESVRAALH